MRDHSNHIICCRQDYYRRVGKRTTDNYYLYYEICVDCEGQIVSHDCWRRIWYGDKFDYGEFQDGSLALDHNEFLEVEFKDCLLYTSPSPRDRG